jgi:hypothetical protein
MHPMRTDQSEFVTKRPGFSVRLDSPFLVWLVLPTLLNFLVWEVALYYPINYDVECTYSNPLDAQMNPIRVVKDTDTRRLLGIDDNFLNFNILCDIPYEEKFSYQNCSTVYHPRSANFEVPRHRIPLRVSLGTIVPVLALGLLYVPLVMWTSWNVAKRSAIPRQTSLESDNVPNVPRILGFGHWLWFSAPAAMIMADFVPSSDLLGIPWGQAARYYAVLAAILACAWWLAAAAFIIPRKVKSLAPFRPGPMGTVAG